MEGEVVGTGEVVEDGLLLVADREAIDIEKRKTI
jgi:hypothetical protein